MTTAIVNVIVIRIRSNEPDKWTFPMGRFGAFNVTYSPNYEIALIMQASCSVICTTATLFCDVLIVSSLLHVTAQFKMLQYRIRTVLVRADTLMTEVIHTYC